MDKLLLLSGGGSEQDSLLLDKYFLGTLKRNKVLYIPIAMETNSIGFESCYDWMTNALTKISEEFIDITMWLDLKNKTLADVLEYDAIYIGGGNTYKLLQEIYESKFDKVLLDFISKNKIVYGGSAGAIILGKDIRTVAEENDKNYKYDAGLNQLNNYSVRCHYNNDDTKILNYIDIYKTPVIALPEKSGIKVAESRVIVIGYESILVFDTNKGKKVINPGESFTL